MRRLVLISFFVFLIPFLILAQSPDPIETFDVYIDSSYWNFEISDNADSTLSFVNHSLSADPVKYGDGAMRLEYGAHNIESWGGYAKIEHILPDSQLYDWTAWDSIGFWYYNETAQSLEGRINLRFQLYDVSDVDDTTSTASAMEFYYSFHYILDNEPGWNEIVMPLKDGRGDETLDEWNGEAFNRTGWSGVTGNDFLDKDAIKGWAFEFSISGSGEDDESHGSIVIDHLALKGFAGKSLILFNGMNMNPALEVFTWGQSALEVVEGEGYVAGSNALKWTQGNEWGNGYSGAGWNIPPIDLSREWMRDSLRFWMKADVGVGEMRAQFEDGAAKVGINFSPAADDGDWHEYALALQDFVYQEGTADLDTTNLVVFQVLGEGTAEAGKVILFDEFWTGNPVIDVIAPLPPEGVSGVPNATDYYNLVIWQDVEGEEDETYTVYASEEPIVDVEAAGVEIVATGVPESETSSNSAAHYLSYPLADKEVSYYYAVTCKDQAGNVGDAGLASSVTVNTAKAAPTISLVIPGDLEVDGDISEWLDSDLMPFELMPSLGTHIAVGTEANFDGDADLSVTGYLAIDDDYLYGAFAVTDDIYSYDPAGDFWQDDIIELYLGFYNLKEPHAGFERGAEPDYKFLILSTLMTDEQSGNIDDPLMVNDDPGYEFVDFGASDWEVEFQLSLDTLAEASGDDRFYPVNGMTIPIDIVIHDSDETNVRDGALSLSPNNNDNSYQSPMNWTKTWIGDTNKVATAIGDESDNVVKSFELRQNYPNPFNPVTNIEYSLPRAGDVNLSVYNVVGQKIATLVKGKQSAGNHLVQFTGNQFASGVYFYKIEAAGQVKIRKMLLVK